MKGPIARDWYVIRVQDLFSLYARDLWRTTWSTFKTFGLFKHKIHEGAYYTWVARDPCTRSFCLYKHEICEGVNYTWVARDPC